jgi:hypothetical protein
MYACRQPKWKSFDPFASNWIFNSRKLSEERSKKGSNSFATLDCQAESKSHDENGSRTRMPEKMKIGTKAMV